MHDLLRTFREFIRSSLSVPTMDSPDQDKCRLFAVLLASTILSGCAAADASHQRLVSKPNMQFSESSVFTYQGKLFSQTEPGNASSGGSQSAGCTSCR